jgi:methionyl aminopeptidase
MKKKGIVHGPSQDKRIELKSQAQIEVMLENGQMLRKVMDQVCAMIRPGVTTQEVDQCAYELLMELGVVPAFLGLYGFPGTMCISVNEEIVHGIPGSRKLVGGDIVSFDCGLIRKELYADTARTVAVGEIDGISRRLIEVTTRSLELGIEQLQPGNRLGDVSHAVQAYVEDEGFSVVREYTGHGIGRQLHEEPKIPNHGEPGRGVRWREGMVVCIEPMVNVGTHKTRTLSDNWTVVTADGKRSAHMEHTVAITAEGPLILTGDAK